MNDSIPFNRPFLAGNELEFIKDAVKRGKVSGNGYYTKACQDFFRQKYGYRKCLLTTSGTDALEMAAILCNIKAGDEVIVPSYTFVSTANAFILRGAKIVFADSCNNHPGINEDKIEELITSRTRAIVPVHYAGVACDMDKIMALANKYNLLVIEDAAQAIDSYYKGKPLGSIGHLGCLSFHETKNIQCGEGGMLVINDERFFNRSEIIWEKGTNRAEFFRGEANKYGWVDIGSSFLLSELGAAFLYAQLERIKDIQNKRKTLWNIYFKYLGILEKRGICLPVIPEYSTNNAHMFYLVCKNPEQRTGLINILMKNDIMAVFHYQSLHKSLYYQTKHDGRNLPEADRYSDNLLRLPLYFELESKELELVCELINDFFII